MTMAMNQKNIILNILSRISVLSEVPKKFLEGLTEQVGILHLKQDSLLFREGEAGENCYIVVNGELKIYKNYQGKEAILKIAGPGEIIGERSVFDDLPREASVCALEDSIVLTIPKSALLEFLQQNPGIYLKILRVMSLRLREEEGIIYEWIVTQSSVTTEDLSDTGNELKDSLPDEAKALSREISNFAINEVAVTTQEPLKAFEEILRRSVGVAEGQENAEGEDTAKEQDESTRQDPNWFYEKKHICPLCQKETRSFAVRSRYIQVTKMEDEFCPSYRLVNPDLYRVIICVHCGFGFTEDAPKSLTPEKAQLAKASFVPLQGDFSGFRTLEAAILTYQTAIKCQTAANADHYLLGYLNLKLSCLYKEKGLEQEMKACLQEALEHFKVSMTNERNTEKESFNLAYMIGEIYRRFGQYADAMYWFRYILNHPERKSHRYILNKTQDRWIELRQEMRKE